MVLLAGPRQCGKTTVAKAFVEERKGRYYSWDRLQDRRTIQAYELDAGARLWAFDELHKYRRWRGFLKSAYDEFGDERSILVTGSARLELYGRGGDSLQGRYFPHRLHPFTLAEILGRNFEWERFRREQFESEPGAVSVLKDMHRLGGFPEPFLSGSDRTAARWRLAYGTRLVREDVRDLERVQDLDRMELFYDRLSEVVGAPLSINALREDLEVAFATVKNWLSIFERLYGVFRLPPFGAPRVRAVKKESKLYFWDWARVAEPAQRFENLVAAHLLRLCHWLEDVEGKRCELRYFRTATGQEVDFIVVERRKPLFAVECKATERPVDSGLAYFLERFGKMPAYQVCLEGERDVVARSRSGARVRVLPAARFLAQMP